MTKNNFEKFNNEDINECTSRGMCSIAPNIAALQELVMYFLKQSAFYLLKLEKLGANNQSIKTEIINDLSALIFVNEFNEEQLFSIAMKGYFLLQNVKQTYKKQCSTKNINCFELNEKINFNNKTPLSKAISYGENLLLGKYNNIQSEKRNLLDILEIVIKSTSLHLAKLNDMGYFEEFTFYIILKALNEYNHNKITAKIIEEYTSKLAELDNDLMLKISKILTDKYGDIEKSTVSYSTEKGKAILVSGSNFSELEELLKQTQNQNLDIYTHSELLLANTLPNFKKYPHLKGHFGDKTESNILDFATFPGAIVLTKNSKKNSEYFYRGRLFSSGYIVPKGVIQIKNNDYSEVIKSAKEAKGFKTGKSKPSEELGYNKELIQKEFFNIKTKMETGEIKRLFIIGMNTTSEIQKEYFKNLICKIKPDEYVISLMDTKEKENILQINLGDFLPFATDLLHMLFENFSISQKNIYFFFTNCNVITISNIITLKTHNAQNIFMADCPPTFLNPSVFTTLKREYQIKTTTTPELDLKLIREK